MEGVDEESVVTQSIEISAAATSFYRVLRYSVASPSENPDAVLLQISDYLLPPESSAVVLYNEFVIGDSLVFYEAEPWQYNWDYSWAGEGVEVFRDCRRNGGFARYGEDTCAVDLPKARGSQSFRSDESCLEPNLGCRHSHVGRGMNMDVQD